MSAIAGIYHFNNNSINNDQINLMMNAFQHFPSNSSRVLVKNHLFMGCHAQWITPESVGEVLPYYDSDKKLAITADAIIDNRQELFDLLMVDKINRISMTDSEIILLAYEKWGGNAPKYLIGEFAFLIWDERTDHLFGARDFSGSRTFYYSNNENSFLFCTTITPLLKINGSNKKMNTDWMAEFLAIPGMNEAVSMDLTVYKGVFQLPPSHSIIIKNGSVNTQRYSNLSNTQKLRLKSSEEYVEAFEDVFNNAIKSRLRTHRNVGAHLSGGLDSGTVVSFAANQLREQNKQLFTYSYIPPKDFKDWTPKSLLADESTYIRSTINHVGNIVADYDSYPKHPLLEIKQWHQTMEMPYKFFANSNWIRGIFEKSSSNDIGILLNGGRGNLSISWGPALEYYALLLKRMRWIKLFKELNLYSRNIGGNRLRLVPVLGKISFPLLNFNESNTLKEESLINDQFAKETFVFNKLEENGLFLNNNKIFDFPNSRIRHFEQLFSWNSTGTLGTKLSLENALWKRDPTNDLRVIKFCLSTPIDQFVREGMGRALVRNVSKSYLPDEVRLNQKVRGIQGADYIHRLKPHWKEFENELYKISDDSVMSELINMNLFNAAFKKIKNNPRLEYSYDRDFQVLINSLNVFYFIKRHF
ncbi:asparagine synthase-related protein [Metabacillus indicus]|uniref:asparagine synthase-related protein n=1 Tax=Metabacillus indicus TaxID=246786 RepID=UPI0004937796|nr:asparagine synthase-related protein [Metabacillus indicus]KEZ50321.1 asparagine synthase [Metabacillus indicus LMG 22858]